MLPLERGTRFLLARQGNDGLWRDFHTPAGEASEWPTGFVGAALRGAGAESSPLERAADALVGRQNADGGWGYNEDVPSDADSTACVLLLLACLGRRGGACDRAVSCLLAHQHENGGIATYAESGPIREFMGVGRWMRFGGWCSPQPEVTAAAGRALAAVAPGECSSEIDAAWRYVRSRQRPDGSWPSYWWTSPHYATQQAVELGASLDDHSAVARAGEWALRDDGDGSPFATALSVSVLRRANATWEAVENATSRLVALQDDDGGWPSRPIVRIPLPDDVDPDRRHRRLLLSLGLGVVVDDQHRTFTTAACLAALAQARES